VWDLQQLTNNTSGNATTLDKPQWSIPNSASLGAPVQVRICGDLVAVNAVDYSIKVFRLLANGAHQVISQAAGDQA